MELRTFSTEWGLDCGLGKMVGVGSEAGRELDDVEEK
jgi:hypothetical protein